MIKWEGLTDIVLVGHSYGGVIITGVAEQVPTTISSIVFLDAFMPENGQSLPDIAPRTRDSSATARQKGEITQPPIPAAVFLVNEKDRAWVDSMCPPHPIATFADKSVVSGARDRIAKRSYIRAKGYPNAIFDGYQAQCTRAAGWGVHSLQIVARRKSLHVRKAPKADAKSEPWRLSRRVTAAVAVSPDNVPL